MKSILLTTVLIAAGVTVAGCGRKLNGVMPNQPPAIELSGAPVASAAGDSRYQAKWSGTDADGRVDHYVVAVDPPSVDRVDEHWTITHELQQVVAFPASAVRGARDEGAGTAPRTPHVVAVRAVDDRGAMSEVRSIGFFAGNQAPTVAITSPHPSSLATAILPPCFHVNWEGNDPDGVFTNHPVKYKWIVLSASSEFPINVALADPDSLRRYYAPQFATWDSVSGDTTTIQLCNLSVGQEYVIAIVAFDEAGDYSPVFSLNTNMLHFRVGFAKSLGPRITFFNETIVYTYPGGGYVDDPMQYVHVEIPQAMPFTLHWFAIPQAGLEPVRYRWVIDPNDLYDETPR
jgi:hypothetical protein